MKSVKLADFLKQIQTSDFFNQKKSFLFTGVSGLVPILFCLFMRRFFQKKGMACTSLDISKITPAVLYASLETSFLGMSTCYWLKNSTELDAKSQKAFFEYLQSYAGPHLICLYAPEIDVAPFGESWVSVQLPLEIDHSLFLLLADIFEKKLSRQNTHMIRRLFFVHKQVPLDVGCMIMEYASVFGSSDDQEAFQHIEAMLDAKSSLFLVSGHLFAKQPRAFFASWREMSGEYQGPFWIAFWTEQMWRAYYVIKYMQENRQLDAKKIGFRLPFSFLQRDYKKVSCKELQRAHQFLYEADFQLKNSSSDLSLDLFFDRFLTGSFAR